MRFRGLIRAHNAEPPPARISILNLFEQTIATFFTVFRASRIYAITERAYSTRLGDYPIIRFYFR